MNTSPCCVSVLSNHIFQRKTTLHGHFWLEKDKEREANKRSKEITICDCTLLNDSCTTTGNHRLFLTPVRGGMSGISLRYVLTWCDLSDVLYLCSDSIKCQAKLKKSLHESRQPIVYFESHRVDFCDGCDAHSLALSKTCLGKFVGIVLWFLWLWLWSETQENFLASTSEWILHVRIR